LQRIKGKDRESPDVTKANRKHLVAGLFIVETIVIDFSL
jgi:hypothetical protein